MTKHKYALHLGCTVPVRGLNYELSTRKVAEKLGIELVDIPDFSCCGYPVDGLHHHTAIIFAARNLALAEAQGLDIVTLCSACTGHMTKVQKLLTSKKGEKELKKVNEELSKLGCKYTGKTKVKHIARVLIEDIGIDKIKKAVTQPLDNISVAPHYGCHYVKPSEIFDGFDNPIHPETLDKLIEATGAKPVDYKNKMQCCGGGVLSVNEETPMKMVKQKLDNVKEVGADAMTLICPFCSIMYDEFQPTIESKFETEYKIPVLYYPQLLGIAMGFDPKKELAVKKNQVSVKPLLRKIEGSDNGSE